MNSGGLTFRGQRRAWVLRTRLSFTFWRPQESIWMELTGLISPAIQQTTKDTNDFSSWRFWNRYIYLESFGGYLTFWVISYRAPITQRLFDIQLAPTGPVSRQVAVRQNGQLLLDLGLVFFLLAESGGAQLAAQRSEHSCPPCWAGLRESLHSKTLALLMKSNKYIQDCIGVLTCKWGCLNWWQLLWEYGDKSSHLITSPHQMATLGTCLDMLVHHVGHSQDPVVWLDFPLRLESPLFYPKLGWWFF